MRGLSRRMVVRLGMNSVVVRPRPFPGMEVTVRWDEEMWGADCADGKAADMAFAALGVAMMLRPWFVRNLEVVCVQYCFPFLVVQWGRCDQIGCWKSFASWFGHSGFWSERRCCAVSAHCCGWTRAAAQMVLPQIRVAKVCIVVFISIMWC